MYIACVSFALGVVGTAVGFAFGVVPYFRATLDLTQYDWFFLTSIAICALIGFVIGVLNGGRWYRKTEASPLIQRRMLAYLERRGSDARGVTVRSVNTISLRSLLGTKRQQQG
jgi:hypothetical protein